jgi:hypothetical protein
MTMTRANVVTLTNLIAHGSGDSDLMPDAYDGALDRLARSAAPFVDTEAFTPTDGTAEYSYPSTAVALLGVFHGAKQLPQASSKELEAYDEDWRGADEGTPVVFSFYERDADKVLLFPTPDTTASDGGTFLFSENRTTDIPEWLALPIVFDILAEEFSYPSDHQDKEYAAMCGEMAQILKAFTGIL